MPFRRKAVRRFAAGRKTFRKKPAVATVARRRKPMVHRSKTAGSSRFPRRKIVQHDSTTSPPMAFSHGRKVMVNKSFVSKVRQAIETPNRWMADLAYQLNWLNGQCSYGLGSWIHNPNDYIVIASNIDSSGSKYFLRMNVHEVSSLSQITNMSNVSAFVRVYECQCRQDIPYNSNVYNSGDPWTYLFNQGITQQGTSAVATSISSTLFMSQEFVTRIKILHTRDFQLRAGETKSITLADNKPVVINMSRIQDDNTQLILGLRNHTRFIIYQAWGQPVDNAATQTTTTSSIGKLSIIERIRYTYSWINDYDASNYLSETLPTTATTYDSIQDLTGVTQTTTIV